MRLAVKIDTSALEHGLRELPSQIPFATSYAMNAAAKAVIPVLRKDILKVFTIRNNWEAMGITFKAAHKRDLSIEIGSRHDYMVAQVVGGEKEAREGGTVGVPMVGRGLPRPTIKARTTPRKHPKALIAEGAGEVFAGTIQTKKGPMYGVWRRVWRAKVGGKIVRQRSEKARPGVLLLYQLEEKVKIPKRWPLKEQVVAAWTANWPRAVKESLDFTLRKVAEWRRKGVWRA